MEKGVPIHTWSYTGLKKNANIISTDGEKIVASVITGFHGYYHVPNKPNFLLITPQDATQLKI